MPTLVRTGFEEYVSTRSGVLLRFAYLLCGDRHLAEDLVQEVLIKAHRRWSAIESDNPDAYLKQALVRTHVSWLRRRASSEIATATFRDGPGGGFDDAHASRDELWALLEKLPRAQRAVLVLRYFEDLEDRRIAELVGVSASTVRTHAHRGLQALRETLAQRADEAPSGAGMLENVRLGATRAAARRRAAIAGGVAAILAVLLLLPPLLWPDRPRPPGGPNPTPTVTTTPTSDLVLVRTTLTAPTFPYTFGYLPPGIGPAYVALLENGPVVYWGGSDLNNNSIVSPDLAILMRAEPPQPGNAGQFQVGSTVTVNGVTTELWVAPIGSGNPHVELGWWQQDGRWFWAQTYNGPFGPDEVRRFAESLTPGITASATTGPIDGVAAVMLPTGFGIYEWDQDHVCARPGSAAPVTGALCITLLAADPGAPHVQDFLINGDPAWIYDPIPGSRHLIVQRSDERLVEVWDSTAVRTAADLIAIYRGIAFSPV